MENISVCYIYKITNNLSDKSYIGSRINDNPYEDFKYMGSSKYLNEDFDLLGIENFKKEIVEVFYNISKKELLDKETKLILFYDTLNPKGYNKHLPNKYTSWHRGGVPLSEESKRKISKGLKRAYAEGRKAVPDYKGEKHPMFGKHHTEEAKIKCGNSFRGKKHKEETKIKMSESHTGVKKTKEHAENISKGRKGMVFSKEHKANISKGKKGKSFIYTKEGRETHLKMLNELNNRKIKCPKCGKSFNPGNYGRHRKRTCID
jgi:group I intron endonuclease